MGELHTNSKCLARCNETLGVAEVASVAKWLEAAASRPRTRWANMQGPGIDDAYRFRSVRREHSTAVHGMFRVWLERTFPKPSRFEGRSQCRST